MNAVRIDVDRGGEVPVIILEGDIDVVNHDAVRVQLLRLALEVGPRFVSDFGAVGYVDSNGVRTLFELAREFDQSRIEWVVVLGADSPLHRLFKVTAFDEVVRIAASRASAFALFGNDS